MTASVYLHDPSRIRLQDVNVEELICSGAAAIVCLYMLPDDNMLLELIKAKWLMTTLLL